MSNLLCVDWDFFFVNRFEAARGFDAEAAFYDWGHSESFPVFLSTVLWQTRAAAFLQAGKPLPQISEPEGGWAGFWSRFEFAPDAEFTYADSNAWAARLEPLDGAEAFEKVVLFDAHHDSGYGIKSYTEYLAQPGFSCEDWMLEHQRAGTTDLTIRYPRWKTAALDERLPEGVLTRQMVDDGARLDGVVFDAVFVCRSGAWVPPWCDQDFLTFINACPLQGEQIDDGEDMVRGFDLDHARVEAERMAAMWPPNGSGVASEE